VSVVASLGDASLLLPVAAHSDCGKPMAAAGHGHGPPDFRPSKMEDRQFDSQEAVETPGS
jgi:hypothetical protein